MVVVVSVILMATGAMGEKKEKLKDQVAALKAAVAALESNLTAVKNDLAAVAEVPVGTVVPFAGPPGNVPDGWFLCDGSPRSSGDFPALFAAIGQAHGDGSDGTVTDDFNLPDYRGRFLRGVDTSEGRDPEAVGRSPMNVNGNSGDAVGSIQASATALPTNGFTTDVTDPHNHSFTDFVNPSGRVGVLGAPSGVLALSVNTSTQGGGVHSHVVTGGGDAETRPA